MLTCAFVNDIIDLSSPAGSKRKMLNTFTNRIQRIKAVKRITNTVHCTYKRLCYCRRTNDASTLSAEIVYNAAQMFDGLHLKTSARSELPSRSFKVTAVATI